MIRDLEFPEEVRAIWLEGPFSRLIGYGVFVFRAGPWLIDAGFRNARGRLLAWPQLDEARACLLSHHDEDHTGNAAALAESGLEVLAPPLVIERLKSASPLPLYRRLVWGTGEVGGVSELTGDADAEGWHLTPIHTPGHSDDHFVFHAPERRLVFSADLFIARRVPVAKLSEDLAQLIASLRTVCDLKPHVMFCAHRGRVEHPAEVLEEKIDWLEEIIARAKELKENGMHVKAIARRLLGPKEMIDWFSRGEYSRRNLIEAALRG